MYDKGNKDKATWYLKGKKDEGFGISRKLFGNHI